MKNEARINPSLLSYFGTVNTQEINFRKYVTLFPNRDSISQP